METGRTIRLVKEDSFARYRYCNNYHWLTQKCIAWKEDKYDLNDPAVRQRLIDLGYVLQKRQDPK